MTPLPQFRAEPRPSDRDAIRAIVASTGFFHPHEIEVAVELIDERLARGPASGYHFLFADDPKSSAPLAYACFGPIACTTAGIDLYWIAVHADHQGRGHGLSLLAETERRIAAGLPDAPHPFNTPAPGRRVYIETSGRELYRPTQGFYRRAGYALEATLRDFYAPGDDKLIFSKRLP